jgi:hypothetical protein
LVVNTTGATNVAMAATGALTSVDASGATGAVTLDLSGGGVSFGSSAESLLGGAGGATFKLAAGVLGNGATWTITGNSAGTNKLQIGDAAVTATTSAALNKAINAATNFKTLEFFNATDAAAAATTAADSLAANGVTSMSDFLFSGAIANATQSTAGNGVAAISVTGQTNAQTFTITASETGQASKAASTSTGGDAVVFAPVIDNGSNTLNLTVGKATGTGITFTGGAANTTGVNGSGLNVAPFETVNLTSSSTGATTAVNTFTAGAGGSTAGGYGLTVETNSTINLSGNSSTTFSTIGGVAVNGLLNVTLNAGTNTGKTTATFSVAGNDTFTSSAGGSAVTFAAGVDTVNLSASTAKNDTLTFGSAANETSTAFHQVTGFTLGTATTVADRLIINQGDTAAVATDASTQAFTLGAGTATTYTSLSGVVTIANSAATLTDYINAAIKAAGNAGGEAAFQFNGSTYVVESHAAGHSTFTAGTDSLVQLVGVTGVTALSVAGSPTLTATTLWVG